MTRRRFVWTPILLTALADLAMAGTSSSSSSAAFAFAPENSGDKRTQKQESNDVINGAINGYTPSSSAFSSTVVSYRSLNVPVPTFGVSVPVAVWYPNTANSDSTKKEEEETTKSLIMDYPQASSSIDTNNKNANAATYAHRISVKKIGKMLAGWDFIPDFASKDFVLPSTNTNVILDQGQGIPKQGPLVLLAHGYLGSRFDLSHLAESLAQQGFTCMSVEYPESLAASYSTTEKEGLDRTVITNALLDYVKTTLEMTPSSYAMVGHSLGCGTVLMTGDDTWTRVCIAGPPVRRDGVSFPKTLLIASVNDGAVTMERIGSMIPTDFVRLDSKLDKENLPKKAAYIFDDTQTAPNHISFLADGTNQAMIQFLSPLLPIAQALNIPVLDFDKYKLSQDSQPTANVVIPLVSSYLKQNMSL